MGCMPWRRTALPVVQLAGNELVHPPQPVCDEGCEAVLACAPLCGTRRQTCRQRKALPTVACAVHRATCVVKHATGRRSQASCKLSLMGAAVSTGRNYWARPRHICTRTGSCCSAEPTLSLSLCAIPASAAAASSRLPPPLPRGGRMPPTVFARARRRPSRPLLFGVRSPPTRRLSACVQSPVCADTSVSNRSKRRRASR